MTAAGPTHGGRLPGLQTSQTQLLSLQAGIPDKQTEDSVCNAICLQAADTVRANTRSVSLACR